jgi:hypothetical protein
MATRNPATVVLLAVGVILLGLSAGGARQSEAMHPCAPTGIQGDNNDDGAVTATDALLALRAAAGYYVHSACGPFDVDCDHDVDSVDALKILLYEAGLKYSQIEPCPDIATKAGDP